jgi:hypothetical protein
VQLAVCYISCNLRPLEHDDRPKTEPEDNNTAANNEASEPGRQGFGAIASDSAANIMQVLQCVPAGLGTIG